MKESIADPPFGPGPAVSWYGILDAAVPRTQWTCVLLESLRGSKLAGHTFLVFLLYWYFSDWTGQGRRVALWASRLFSRRYFLLGSVLICHLDDRVAFQPGSVGTDEATCNQCVANRARALVTHAGCSWAELAPFQHVHRDHSVFCEMCNHSCEQHIFSTGGRRARSRRGCRFPVLFRHGCASVKGELDSACW